MWKVKEGKIPKNLQETDKELRKVKIIKNAKQRKESVK